MVVWIPLRRAFSSSRVADSFGDRGVAVARLALSGGELTFVRLWCVGIKGVDICSNRQTPNQGKRKKEEKTPLTSYTEQHGPHVRGIPLRPDSTRLDAPDVIPNQRLRLPRRRWPGAQNPSGAPGHQRATADVVQRRTHRHDGFDVDFLREQQGHLHGQIAAGARADGRDAAEVGGRVPGFSVRDRGQLVVHPVGEGLDVVQDVGAGGFGEEAVVRADDEGVVRKGEFEEPATYPRKFQRYHDCFSRVEECKEWN